MAVMALAYFLSCNHHNDLPKKTFVLVHGAWQGAWVWKDVKSDLERAGQAVVVVEPKILLHGCGMAEQEART